MIGAGDPLLGGVKAGWLDVEGYRVWTQAFAPQRLGDESEKGTLVHLHGYYDHGALYGGLQHWALSQGLRYLTVDLPGHGLSSGARASIRSFEVYQQLLEQLLSELESGDFPRPWLLSGFSTGGAIALEHLLYGSRFDRVALLAPLVRPLGWKTTRRWLPLASLFIRHLPRKFRDNSHDSNFLHLVRDLDPMQPKQLPLAWVKALARWIPGIEKAASCDDPVLIIQGEADTTVDWQYNLTVLRRLLPNARVHLIKGAAHQLLNEDTERREEVLSHLTQGLLPRLPDQ
jgi:alpha-beta hydrolase superfamily lysophospholipase